MRDGRVVAVEAVERMTDEARSALGRQHPRPLHQRRVVAHVLPVAASQDRPPVAQLVLFEIDNRLFHHGEGMPTRWSRPTGGREK